jgi:AraC-like DNA-binding protein/mannose-6-phosphate isomerase-like protein (cupin superfamily)
MTNWDGFIFQFDKSYEDQMEEFDFIKVRQISENNIEPIREIEEHTQICHEITYIISGKGMFYSGEDETLLQQGDIHVISKGVKHRIVPAERSNLRFANIGFEFSEKMQERLEPIRQLFENCDHFILRDNGDIRILMTMLINEMQSRGAYSHTQLECYIKLILTHVYRMAQNDGQREFSPKKSTSPIKLTPYAIIRYVDNNLFEFPGVDDIARALGYSQSYISHMFKEKMGITLQEYICNKKIEASLDFLKYQKYTVTQVAMMLNYASVQSFCKAFRKAMGCPPTEYQKRHVREKGGDQDHEEV